MSSCVDNLAAHTPSDTIRTSRYIYKIYGAQPIPAATDEQNKDLRKPINLSQALAANIRMTLCADK